MVLETPDKSLRLRGDSESLLKQLQNEWVQETPAIRTLAQYGVVVSEDGDEIGALRRLERYFGERNVETYVVRKGSTRPEFALPREGYMLKAEPRTKGFGQADTKYLALLKAAAEVYERLSCDANVNTDLLVDLEDSVPALDIHRFVRYSEWQLARADFPYGREPSGKWARVENVATNEAFRLPLEIVCYPDRTGSKRVTSATSSGVACHPSFEVALLSSAFELIERDALMVHWFWGVQRERIAPPDEFKSRVLRLESFGFTCTFLNLTLELAPVVLVILRREAESYPRLILGMASHSLPIVAMDKALQEVELNVTFCNIETPSVNAMENIRDVMDHQFWYDKPENHSEVELLIGEDLIEATGIPAGPTDVIGMQTALNRLGTSWYATELNRAGRDTTGLYVVRSLIEGLTPIGFGYMMEALGMERLFRTPTSIASGQFRSLRKTAAGYKTQPFA
ncbi:MAG TPA: YcaO-like family protein [Candidatus Saccharimonas sp.]|nr:YcaO-like family protein [Candidatus Saccharimonas sp.]